jgi:hypothetical protein
MRRWLLHVLIVGFSALVPLCVFSYPLDGDAYTGITRLEGYRLVQEGKVRGLRLPTGALLKLDQVDLRLREKKDFVIPEKDEVLQQQVLELLGNNEDRFSISILDLTDSDKSAYAGHREEVNFNPGSVGKLVVIIALFNELAIAYPDIAEREAVLRETMITADEFIRHDSHEVPFWDATANPLSHRRIREGDTANLWAWLDWMLSASSNAAASMVMKEVLLLARFGSQYPVSEQVAADYFSRSRPADLASHLDSVLDAALSSTGVDTEVFRQGGFFTREGKNRVPAGGSRATTKELLKVLIKLEQGKVIDDFSSREIKRLLYMTQKRIRYASSPALNDAAVYFKSGSLYRCKAEAGFVCGKYKGNVLNLLSSVVIVEDPAGAENGLFYMVVVTSNILRHNAAVEHQTLGTRIHRLMQRRHGIGQ